MLIETALETIKNSCLRVYDADESYASTRLLAEHLFNDSWTNIQLNKNNVLRGSQLVRLFEICTQVLQKQPIQHVIGKVFSAAVNS